jgi:hypothetical protein
LVRVNAPVSPSTRIMAEAASAPFRFAMKRYAFPSF